MITILLPHRLSLDWLAIYSAISAFAVFGLLSVWARRSLRTRTRLPYWIHVAQLVSGSISIGFGIIGTGGTQGGLHLLLILPVMVAASFRRKYLTHIGWFCANTSLIVSTLIVGPDPSACFGLCSELRGG